MSAFVDMKKAIILVTIDVYSSEVFDARFRHFLELGEDDQVY